jgi:hypothetical protein
MMGSGVFAGAVPLAHGLGRGRPAGADGAAGRAAAHRRAGRQEPGAHPVGAYFEAHIEQGPVLEDHATTIGIVTGVLGIRWYDCTVTGMEAHAGPTPMALRKRRAAGGHRLMQEVVAIAHRHGPDGRGTVGQVQVHPNSRNVIPGRVRFSIDLRNAATRCATRWTPTSAPPRPPSSGRERPAGQIEPVSAYPAQPFDAGCVARWRAPPPRLGCQRHAGGVGRRARRRLPGPAGADRHDLRALHRTASATTRSKTPAGTPGSRLQRAAAGDAGTRRRGVDARRCGRQSLHAGAYRVSSALQAPSDRRSAFVCRAHRLLPFRGELARRG